MAVPYFIIILRKCVHYRIDTELIKHLHFYDLQCLLIQFEIQDIERYLEYEHKQRLKDKNIERVDHVSGTDAVKFLKGGN